MKRLIQALAALALGIAFVTGAAAQAPETKSALPPTSACSALAPPAKSGISTSRPSSLK